MSYTGEGDIIWVSTTLAALGSRWTHTHTLAKHRTTHNQIKLEPTIQPSARLWFYYNDDDFLFTLLQSNPIQSRAPNPQYQYPIVKINVFFSYIKARAHSSLPSSPSLLPPFFLFPLLKER